ncbi:MAG: hypothetical protein ACK44W_05655, partial [Planctomycetota bacterium]
MEEENVMRVPDPSPLISGHAPHNEALALRSGNPKAPGRKVHGHSEVTIVKTAKSARMMITGVLVCGGLLGCAKTGDAGSPSDSPPRGDSRSIEAEPAQRPSSGNSPSAGANTPVFFDDFEYEVKRDEINPRPAFITPGKWHAVKAINTGRERAGGYIYTVDRIPGYTGAFPGRNSRRVLVLEAR